MKTPGYRSCWKCRYLPLPSNEKRNPCSITGLDVDLYSSSCDNFEYKRTEDKDKKEVI